MKRLMNSKVLLMLRARSRARLQLYKRTREPVPCYLQAKQFTCPQEFSAGVHRRSLLTSGLAISAAASLQANPAFAQVVSKDWEQVSCDFCTVFASSDVWPSSTLVQFPLTYSWQAEFTCLCKVEICFMHYLAFFCLSIPSPVPDYASPYNR